MSRLFGGMRYVERLYGAHMLAGLVLVALIFLSVVVALGGPMLRRLLAKDHVLQKYLSDDSINGALGWMARNAGKVAGWLLLVAFTVITIVYS